MLQKTWPYGMSVSVSLPEATIFYGDLLAVPNLTLDWSAHPFEYEDKEQKAFSASVAQWYATYLGIPQDALEPDQFVPSQSMLVDPKKLTLDTLFRIFTQKPSTIRGAFSGRVTLVELVSLSETHVKQMDRRSPYELRLWNDVANPETSAWPQTLLENEDVQKRYGAARQAVIEAVHRMKFDPERICDHEVDERTHIKDIKESLRANRGGKALPPL